MDFEIKFEDNSQKVLAELENKIPEILGAIGNEGYKGVTNFIRENNIIDTRRLLGSISYSTPYEDYSNPELSNMAGDFITGNTEKDTTILGSNLYYAVFVNSGTSKQRARKFLETGIYRSTPQMKGAVEKILKGD